MPRKKKEDETLQTGTESAVDAMITPEELEDLRENKEFAQTDNENPKLGDVDLDGEDPGENSCVGDSEIIDNISQSDGETVSGIMAAEGETVESQSERYIPVVSIDERRTVETDADRARNDLIDLTESLKAGVIMSGSIQGIELSGEDKATSRAVLYHGDYKIIIPAKEVVEAPSDYNGMLAEDVIHYMLTKRLGAEIDYVVKGIDEEAHVAVASRLEAMRIKRRRYYFRTDREGNNLIYSGICAEARVVSVIRSGAFVDLFGAETYIPLRELSYQRWLDARMYLQTGQRLLVKVMELEKSGRDGVRVVASVKEATINPYKQAINHYTVGNRYVGTVSMVDTNGVFVALSGGIDCLCSYPLRGRPPRGARVTVKVLGVNEESNRIWGVITHIAVAR